MHTLVQDPTILAQLAHPISSGLSCFLDKFVLLLVHQLCKEVLAIYCMFSCLCLVSLQDLVQPLVANLDHRSFLPCVGPDALQADVAFCVQSELGFALTLFLGFVELGEALYTHETRMLELVGEECDPLLF